MGCFASKELDINDPLYKAKQADRAITEALNQSNKQRKCKKILILGAGESGKSTVLKQLKILHKNGFSHEERAKYTQVIWADAVTCMCVLVAEARKAKIPLECDQLTSSLKIHRYNLSSYQRNILMNIDTDAAGGNKFINDYITKYGPGSQLKRQKDSTGRTEAFDEKLDNEETDTLFFNESIGYKKSEEFDSDSLETSDARTTNNSNLDGNLTGFLGKNRNNNSAKVVSRYEVALAIYELWTKDSGIAKIWARRNEFQMESNADYYFNNIMNFVDEHYLATDSDILSARIKTTGIQESLFTINGEDFKILDAGGQRSERKKWLKSFEDISAVLFVLAVSEYDQVLFEDNKVNRMHEAMMLFKTLVNSRWFYNTPFILFLNKTDLFEEKIKKSPMKRYLPDFNGKVGNFEEGMKYFEDTFLRFNRTKKSVYVHRTCATDTKLMKFVLAAVTDLIIQDNLRATGMM
ncbi:guanine nucleotide-binding protein subunit alpha [Saccharomycopsis crataegensis]|uniref:Guanine nucleotide-binding protein subunit alpha n=1 Tax=Saccharomycopsis crataegensis TaxID=43959 RepID=A0AAV5QUG4_9ASCO|nr:guanine nucleotide-binding protein subunit alpha [Saccharomycopsis crataegensis]